MAVNVRSAKAGEVVHLPTHLVDTDEEDQLRAACEESLGQWACSTHRKTFANNLQASIHEDAGKHVVYWFCHLHGPEAA